MHVFHYLSISIIMYIVNRIIMLRNEHVYRIRSLVKELRMNSDTHIPTSIIDTCIKYIGISL